jgi:hypothetical protein
MQRRFNIGRRLATIHDKSVLEYLISPTSFVAVMKNRRDQHLKVLKEQAEALKQGSDEQQDRPPSRTEDV